MTQQLVWTEKGVGVNSSFEACVPRECMVMKDLPQKTKQKEHTPHVARDGGHLVWTDEGVAVNSSYEAWVPSERMVMKACNNKKQKNERAHAARRQRRRPPGVNRYRRGCEQQYQGYGREFEQQ